MREIRTSGSRRGGALVPSYSTGSESAFYVYSHLLSRDGHGVPMALRATKGDENGFEWSTIVIAGDGRGRNRSGDVEAATEFDPGRVC